MQNNNRYSKYVALVALLIAIVGVSLGFAAYSNTVTIKAAADYRADPKPVVELSTDPDGQDDGPVTPTTTGGATAEDADLTDDTIDDINRGCLVNFNEELWLVENVQRQRPSPCLGALSFHFLIEGIIPASFLQII